MAYLAPFVFANYAINQRILEYYFMNDLLATFLLLVYLMKLSGEKGLKRSVVISFVTVFLIYIVFYRLLVIPFPQGILRI